MELIDLMNSCSLTEIVNFPTWILGCDSHSLAFLDFFISSDTSIYSTIASPPLGNSDRVVVFVFSRYFCKQLNIILWFAILQFMERYMHHWLQTWRNITLLKMTQFLPQSPFHSRIQEGDQEWHPRNMAFTKMTSSSS